MSLSRISAVFFFLWGALHVVGGVAILFALSAGPDAGFAIYANSKGEYPALAGAILAMNSLNIAAIGAVICAVSIGLTWRGHIVGPLISIALAGAADFGLIIFLLPEGFVSIPEAAIGISLYLIGLGASLADVKRAFSAPHAA